MSVTQSSPKLSAQDRGRLGGYRRRADKLAAEHVIGVGDYGELLALIRARSIDELRRRFLVIESEKWRTDPPKWSVAWRRARLDEISSKRADLHAGAIDTTVPRGDRHIARDELRLLSIEAQLLRQGLAHEDGPVRYRGPKRRPPREIQPASLERRRRRDKRRLVKVWPGSDQLHQRALGYRAASFRWGRPVSYRTALLAIGERLRSRSSNQRASSGTAASGEAGHAS